MYMLVITRIISHTYCFANVSSIDTSHTRRTNMTASDSIISPLAFFFKFKKDQLKSIQYLTQTLCMYSHFHMGWLRLVGSLKLQVSFAECSLFYRVLLQKRPRILRSLLVVATPYTTDVTTSDSTISAFRPPVTIVSRLSRGIKKNDNASMCVLTCVHATNVTAPNCNIVSRFLKILGLFCKRTL